MSSRIEKKDLKKVFFRHLSIGSMNDYQGVLHHGYTYSMLPIIDKVYDDKEDRIKAKKRHMMSILLLHLMFQVLHLVLLQPWKKKMRTIQILMKKQLVQ